VLAASVSCGKKSSTSASTDFSQTVTGTVTPFATNSHSVSVGQSGTLLLRAGAFTASNDPDHEDRSGTFGVGYAAKSKFQVDLAFVTKHKRIVASAGVRF